MTGDREREVLAAFVVGAVLAGGNSVAIRFSNRELAPLWGAGLRFALATVLLVVIMAALKLALPRGRALVGSLLYGLIQFGGAFGLYYYALVRLHAGLGQTLLALVPSRRCSSPWPNVKSASAVRLSWELSSGLSVSA